MPDRRTFVFVTPYLDSVENWIEPLAGFLRDDGFRIVVFHCHSLSYGQNPDPGPLPGYELHDHSRTAPKNLGKALQALSPRALCFLNFQSLFELLMVRLGRDLSIPSVFLQHGHFNDHTFKYLMARPDLSLRRYLRLGGTVGRYVLGKGLGAATDFVRAFALRDYRDLRADQALLYSPASRDFLVPRFGWSEETIHISGYPVFMNEHDRDYLPPSSGHVLYLHQPHRQNGASSASADKERNYFLRLHELCADKGYPLRIRLHPRAFRDDYEAMFRDTPVVLVPSEVLTWDVAQADLVLGQWSTACFSAVRLDKPLGLIFFPELRELEHALEAVGIRVADETALEALLSDPSSWTSRLDRYPAFREHVLGPPSSHERWARTLVSITDEAP